MKILHYTLGLPPYRTGGLTKYSIDLMQIQQKSIHEVSLIYPGNSTVSRKLYIKRGNDYGGIKVYQIKNPLPVPLLGGIKSPRSFMKEVNENEFIRILRVINPDIIHLHTLMGLHKEFLVAAKQLNIKIIFTTHDYFGICPKVNLLDTKLTNCINYNNGHSCVECNKNGYSLSMIHLMQSNLYRNFKNSSFFVKLRMYKKGSYKRLQKSKELVDTSLTNSNLAKDYVLLRKYYLEMLKYVDNFHFNSTIAEEEYKKYIPIKGRVIPITHSNIEDRRKFRAVKNRDLRITYLGPVDYYKGFYLLKSSLDRLIDDNKRDWKLNVYGDVLENNLEDNEFHYSFNGKYNYYELDNIFENTDVLVIPSIWKETFGFIGLEALSYGIPILVSSNTGFKDIVLKYKAGIIFEPNVQSLKEALENIIDNKGILNIFNENIIDSNIEFSLINHAERLLELYKITID